MKKLLLFLLLLPTLFYGQNYTMNPVKILLSDLTTTYMGGGSGSISMTDNVLTISFSAGWNSAPMRLGIIKSLNVNPPLPNIDLGPILNSNKQSSGYFARIVNNNLEFYSNYGSQPIQTGCNFNFTKTYPKSTTLTNSKVTFTYDNAGNQVIREVVFIKSALKTNSTKANIAAANEPELKPFFPGDELSYYPNPVKEELYLKWGLINDNEVSAIQVFSLSGRLLQTYTSFSSDRSHQISFQVYPAGVYMVILNYKDGVQKSIKIVKAN
jgi:hypothetical protein